MLEFSYNLRCHHVRTECECLIYKILFIPQKLKEVPSFFIPFHMHGTFIQLFKNSSKIISHIFIAILDLNLFFIFSFLLFSSPLITQKTITIIDINIHKKIIFDHFQKKSQIILGSSSFYFSPKLLFSLPLISQQTLISG